MKKHKQKKNKKVDANSEGVVTPHAVEKGCGGNDRSTFGIFESIAKNGPEQPLAINTAEFWKPKEALEAFDLMYSATRTALNDSFLELSDPNDLRMTLVGPQGQTTILDNF